MGACRCAQVALIWCVRPVMRLISSSVPYLYRVCCGNQKLRLAGSGCRGQVPGCRISFSCGSFRSRQMKPSTSSGSSTLPQTIAWYVLCTWRSANSLSERRPGLVGLGDDHEAFGFAVEPVHDAGALGVRGELLDLALRARAPGCRYRWRPQGARSCRPACAQWPGTRLRRAPEPLLQTAESLPTSLLADGIADGRGALFALKDALRFFRADTLKSGPCSMRRCSCEREKPVAGPAPSSAARNLSSRTPFGQARRCSVLLFAVSYSTPTARYALYFFHSMGIMNVGTRVGRSSCSGRPTSTTGTEI
jgi:hypothetical protein